MSSADTLRRRSGAPPELSMFPSSRLERSVGRGLINSIMAWYFQIRSRFCDFTGAVQLWLGLERFGLVVFRMPDTGEECCIPRERSFRRRMMIAGYLIWWIWWRWGPEAGSRGRRKLGKY